MALFGAVGEVLAAAVFEAGAGGTFADDGDAFGGDACVEQLAAVGFNEVQVDLGADVGVAWGAGGEKEQGIFADGVGVIDLAEDFGV